MQRSDNPGVFLLQPVVQGYRLGGPLNLHSDTLIAQEVSCCLGDMDAAEIARSYDYRLRFHRYHSIQIFDGQVMSLFTPPSSPHTVGCDDDIRVIAVAINLDMSETVV